MSTRTNLSKVFSRIIAALGKSNNIFVRNGNYRRTLSARVVILFSNRSRLPAS